MAKVVPSILAEDKKGFIKLVQTAEGFADYLQVDIMDGNFVPSKSISCEEMADLPITVQWEAHLMTENPENYFYCLKKAGAGRVIFHIEAVKNAKEIIEMAHAIELQAGIAINPETPLEKILPYSGMADSFLFLAVSPGYYGAEFTPKVLDKVIEFRKKAPGAVIGIDGGIKENNIKKAAKAGADLINVGSAISLVENPAVAYRRLSALVN